MKLEFQNEFFLKKVFPLSGKLFQINQIEPIEEFEIKNVVPFFNIIAI